jgi:hypothetical protein
MNNPEIWLITTASCACGKALYRRICKCVDEHAL